MKEEKFGKGSVIFRNNAEGAKILLGFRDLAAVEEKVSQCSLCTGKSDFECRVNLESLPAVDTQE